MHLSNTYIYVTDSNSKFLSHDVITEFRGRGDEIHVYHLRFKELCDSYEDYDKTWGNYYNYGGMPFILSCENNLEKIKYLTSLFDKVYISDIIERHKINNQVDVRIVGIYENNKNNKKILKNYEVNFIVNNGNNKMYIQSAFSIDDEKNLNKNVIH